MPKVVTPGSPRISMGDLGWGTHNSTKFLRGDGEWATPAGGGGSFDTYVFTQSSASTTWNINHGLGRNPLAVAVYDDGGNEIMPDCQCVDSDNVTLTFGFNISGTAYLL